MATADRQRKFRVTLADKGGVIKTVAIYPAAHDVLKRSGEQHNYVINKALLLYGKMLDNTQNGCDSTQKEGL